MHIYEAFFLTTFDFIMRTRSCIWIYTVSILIVAACSPKVNPGSQVATTEEASTETQDTSTEVSPCGKFSDAPDQEQALNAHVIYRDFLRQGNFEEAFPYWEVAYSLAPAADGRRNTHYTDGIRFYDLSVRCLHQ